MRRCPETDEQFHRRVRAAGIQVAVIGLGYAGLPVAHAFAAIGCRVVGIDIDDQRVARLAQGISHLLDVPDDELAAIGGRFTPTTDAAPLADADVVIICTPTPLTADGRPDLSAVAAAADSVAAHVTAGTLVILQSTVPPGTTRMLAEQVASRTGLHLGEDLFFAFGPERVDPANRAGWTVTNTPRVVGGVTGSCTARAAAVMDLLCGRTHVVSDTAVAELSKLLENTFRLVNIGLANEFADVCRDLGASVHEVISAAATKPFGFQPYLPGPGVGGECIPVDPVFLLHDQRRAAVPMPLVQAAYDRMVNRPSQVTDLITELLAAAGRPLAGAKVVVAGVAYKANVDDIRNSPALVVIAQLLERGASVRYCDPLVPEIVVNGQQLKSLRVDANTATGHDCVVLITDHDDLLRVVNWSAAERVLDTRGALPSAPNVVRL